MWNNEIERYPATFWIRIDYSLLTIYRRFRPQALRTAIFHGNKRAKEVQLLLESDVVLTMYHTLENDSSRAKILQSAKWTRVVLDEGTWIP